MAKPEIERKQEALNRMEPFRSRAEKLNELAYKLVPEQNELRATEAKVKKLADEAETFNRRLRSIDTLASTNEYTDEAISTLRSQVVEQQREFEHVLRTARDAAQTIRDRLLPLLVEQTALKGDPEETGKILNEAFVVENEELKIQLDNEEKTAIRRETYLKEIIDKKKAVLAELEGTGYRTSEYKLVNEQVGAMRSEGYDLQGYLDRPDTVKVRLPIAKQRGEAEREVRLDQLLNGKIKQEFEGNLRIVEKNLSSHDRSKPFFGTLLGTESGREWDRERATLDNKVKEIAANIATVEREAEVWKGKQEEWRKRLQEINQGIERGTKAIELIPRFEWFQNTEKSAQNEVQSWNRGVEEVRHRLVLLRDDYRYMAKRLGVTLEEKKPETEG